MKRVMMSIILVLMITLPLYAGNKEDCRQFCRKHKGSVKCSTQLNCGIGFEAMKHFGGKGKNWHACKKK